MTKYKVNGKSYDYDDFYKLAELGLDDFLGEIKRGNIRRKEFVQAYRDLMTGIENGDIIFSSGGLKDTQGRYKNKDSKLKDYYGIMAYYLNDIHNNLSPIPESTDNVTQQTLSEQSLEATSSVSSEEEQSLEQQEVKPIETTKSKGLLFKEYFDQTYLPFAGELPSSFLFLATSFQATDSEFEEWQNRWTEVYKAYLTKSTDALIKSLSNIMANNDKAKEDLNILSQNFNPIVADSFKMGDFAHLVLKALQEKGVLKDSDGKLYIEGLSSAPSVGFIYDKSKQEITPAHYADIDYVRRDAYNKFTSTLNNQNTNPWDAYYATYSGQTASHKNGGVMKMQTGNKFNTPLEAIVYTDEDLQKRYLNVFNDGVFTLLLRKSHATNNSVPSTTEYDLEPGGAELELQQYYQDFLNLLLNNESLAKAWAIDYKNRQKSISDVYADWFDDKGNFLYDKFKENIARVNQDSNNGVGHDIYKGRAYAIKDLEGYYNEIPEGYALIEGEVDSSNPLVTVYKLQQTQNPTVDTDNSTTTTEGTTLTLSTDAQTDQSNNDEADDTIIDARKPKEKGSSKTSSFGIPSTLPGITRMLASMKANKDIENTLLQGLQAHLQNTYSLHHPVFGDLGSRQFYVQLGIDNALRLGASPTSDARTNYNAAIKGIEGINQMNEKGFLADNTEIKRTQAENLKREEDNAARKTSTANANLKELINLAQTKSQIQASRKLKDWASIDELLKSIESDAKTNVERGRQFYIASETGDIDKEYTELYLQLYQKLKQQADEKYNGDITKSPDYDKFILFKSKLTEWRKAKYLNTQARAYGMGIKDGTKGKSAKDYVKDSLLFKHGGSLNHVVMNLINRTMKCE